MGNASFEFDIELRAVQPVRPVGGDREQVIQYTFRFYDIDLFTFSSFSVGNTISAIISLRIGEIGQSLRSISWLSKHHSRWKAMKCGRFKPTRRKFWRIHARVLSSTYFS